MDLVDSVGSRAAGPMWRAFRGSVLAWMQANPADVEAIKADVRRAVQEGRL